MNFISCHTAPHHLGGMWLRSSLGGFAVPLGTLCIFPLGFGWAASSLDLEQFIWYLIDAFSSIMIRSPEKFSQVACWSSYPYLGCGWGCTESPFLLDPCRVSHALMVLVSVFSAGLYSIHNFHRPP